MATSLSPLKIFMEKNYQTQFLLGLLPGQLNLNTSCLGDRQTFVISSYHLFIGLVTSHPLSQTTM